AGLMSKIESLEKQIASANIVKSPEKKCSNCQRVGHLREDCYRRGGGKEGQYPSWWKGKKDTDVNPRPSANMVGEIGESTQHYTLTALAARLDNANDGSEIYADTGASDHFFRNKSDFTSY
ncbi:hypothetical protein F5880DRAFT_1446569, partial [Lentinula raphanica]